MVRSRKSHAADEEEAKASKSRLPKPFAKCGDNHIVVYAIVQREGEKYPRQIVFSFAAIYAARYMIDRLIAGNTYEEATASHGRPAIITDTGVGISCTHLWEILNHELTAEEAAWTDKEISLNVMRFKYARSPEETDDDDTGAGETLPSETERDVEGTGGSEIPKPRRGKAVKAPRAPAEPKQPKAPKPTRAEGTITAQQIAEELGCEGRHVRGVLRASGRTKPETGWAFEPAEAQKVKKEVGAFLKKKGIIK